MNADSYQAKIIPFRMSNADMAKLSQLADHSGLARSEVVRLLIHQTDSLPQIPENDLVRMAIRRPVGRPKAVALGAP